MKELPRCLDCGYDLSGQAEGAGGWRCPECGAVTTSQELDGDAWAGMVQDLAAGGVRPVVWSAGCSLIAYALMFAFRVLGWEGAFDLTLVLLGVGVLSMLVFTAVTPCITASRVVGLARPMRRRDWKFGALRTLVFNTFSVCATLLLGGLGTIVVIVLVR